MNNWFKSGSPWIWLSAGGVSISLISVLGLLWLIASRGLSYFWPADIVEFNLLNEYGVKSVVIGEIYDRERIPAEQLAHTNIKLPVGQETVERLLIKTGNRELVSLDFRWLLVPQITQQSTPENLVVIERRSNGNFYGVIESLMLEGEKVGLSQLALLLERVENFQDKIDTLQKTDIGAINYQLERLRLKERKHKLDGTLTDELSNNFIKDTEVLRAEYGQLEEKLMALRREIARDQLTVRAMDGQVVTINFEDVLAVTFNNKLTLLDKIALFFSQIGGFIVDDPREANTEGGVFPAIFGTVLMVLLMTVIVSPFGVIAAIYLHEYAGNNALTKLLRIAVINLAGVPSIVYGVFGLGFFV
jgi:phosphate transport system permease protein